MKKTKILATIGPKSHDKKILGRMFSSGMDAFRINTAYGNIDQYKEIMERIWAMEDIPAVLDLKGPEIRICSKKIINLSKNSLLTVGEKKSDEVSFNRKIISQLRKGDVVLLEKGKVRSKIVDLYSKKVVLKINRPCTIKDGIGVNIPSRRLKIPTLSTQDKKVIKISKKEGVDYLALSFVRDAYDVKNLKRKIRGSGIDVISKIENIDGIKNISDILFESEGAMIARGDLGIEIPFESIPLIQKDIISRCNRLGKISIVATEMLHSMVENPQPTRAETSDVANAILDGADCIMLSAESAVGKYPVESVRAMANIAREVEKSLQIGHLDEEVHDQVSMAISKAVTSIIETINIDKIVCATHSGYTAKLISNFRVAKDIIAITDDPRIRRKLNLVYAVHPIIHPYFKDTDKINEMARHCLEKKLIQKSDTVLFTAGMHVKKPTTNMIQVHKIKELIG